MRRVLPLYEAPPVLAVDTIEPMARDAECTRCVLSDRVETTVCMPPFGDGPGGLLVIGESPTHDDDIRGRPFTSRWGKTVRDLVAQHWKGSTVYDLAVRCFVGREGLKNFKPIDACRPFLRASLDDVKPTRIITLGAMPAYAMLGRNPLPFTNRRGYAYRVVDYQAEPVPVFNLMSPTSVSGNRFIRAAFEADMAWALTAMPRRPPWDAMIRLVDTVEDARAMVAYLRARPRGFAWDVETGGVMFDPSFRITCSSFCARGEVHAFQMTKRACADVAVREVVLGLLCDPAVPKGGANVKYDMISTYAAWGRMPRGVVFDTRLQRKLLEPEASAKLEHMAELIGMGGMKEENAGAKERALEAVREILSTEKRIAKRLAHPPKGKVKPIPAPPALSTVGVDALLEPVVRDPAHEAPKWVQALIAEEPLYRYNSRDAVATAQLADVLDPELDKVPELRRMWNVVISGANAAIAQMEAWGVAASRDNIMLFDAHVTMVAAQAKQRLDGYFPEVNWRSAPQIREILFGKLGLPVIKFTDSDLESTDKEVLEELKLMHPLCEALIEYRKATKLKGTYAAGDDGKSGILAHVRPDGRIHTSILLDGARSGRTSSQDPNLQNIPRPGTPMAKMARDCFVAPDGYVLVQADYSQLELRVAAMFSGDPLMVQMFQSGKDFHQLTAEMVSQMMWKVPPAQVTKEHRAKVKPVVFGVLYGKGDDALAKDLHCTRAEATRMREAIMGRFTKLDAWCKERLRETQRSGYAWTWWDGQLARRRPLWGVAEQDDLRRSVAEHATWNTPIQGTSADFLTYSLIETVDWVVTDAVPAKVVLPVHDSIMAEVRLDAVEEYVHGVKRIMQSHRMMNGVPLVADIEIGPSWGSLEKIEKTQWKNAA